MARRRDRFDAAVAACPTPFALATCPAAVALAAAVTAAGAWVVAANNALLQCQLQHGYTAGGGANCEEVIIEVSYDGGLTWQYLDTVTICSS
jgi:hypothetical protein